MARRNNNIIIILIIVLVFGFACFMWSNQYKQKNNESYAQPKTVRESNVTPDIEYIPQSDEEDTQMIQQADQDPAFEIGFGMGPGLYGSGRHTSEMVGN
jgi:hypothetical protein